MRLDDVGDAARALQNASAEDGFDVAEHAVEFCAIPCCNFHLDPDNILY